MGSLAPVHAAQPGGVDPWEFRRVVGRFATGVTVVTTVADGEPHGMTANSLTSVSLDPVLVLICVDRTARLLPALDVSGTWAVSVLPAGMDGVSRRFARRAEPGVDQFVGVPVRPGPVTGAPVVEGALAVLECRTWATYDGGDHAIVLGEVLGLEAPADGDPLLHFEGRYRGLAD